MRIKKFFQKRKALKIILLLICLLSLTLFIYQEIVRDFRSRGFPPFIQYVQSDQVQKSTKGTLDVTDVFNKCYPNMKTVSPFLFSELEKYGFKFDREYSNEAKLLFKKKIASPWPCSNDTYLFFEINTGEIKRIKVILEGACL